MRVGVVGVGSMGQNHARVYSEIGQLVGVVDADAAVGQRVATRTKSKYCATVDELVEAGVEAASVAVPTNLHRKVAEELIDAGVHVLVEKPLASTVGEAQKLVRRAEDAGVVLAKQALRAGEFGDLVTASARRVSSFPDRIRDVGVIMDLGIHDVDVLRFIVGTPVESVYASGGRRVHKTFEDHATILMNFGNGVTGFVEVSWLTPMRVRKFALTCSKNFVEVDYTEQSVLISSSTLERYDPSDLYRVSFHYDTRQVAVQKEEPLKRELQDFLAAVEGKRPPLVTGEDAIQTLRVCEAAVRSQREKKLVFL
ncbi:MAG: Gfo/Idh/MocA family oxidoreductase [Methanobacteriota archaeon]|nr:MAG: Gfo/Idh/MocA family oxidoreductase [Euryarchaeota archaeon]